MGAQHIVSISGGKDSTAVYLLAIERGRPFRAVFADTGHEHPLTYEYVRRLPERAGGPPIEWVQADFTRQMAGKRRFILETWPKHGVSAERVARAAEIMQPTGNPFLDLCIWKGRFPSVGRRFCTEELKSLPIDEQIVLPALRCNPVVSWTGERAQESPRRARLQRRQTVRRDEGRHAFFRPILHWPVEAVFWLHDRHGVPPNPLYSKGMGRVGCMPCIMAQKGELRAIGREYPGIIEKLMEMEALVADASKRGAATFFAGDKTPEGAAMAAAGITGGDDGASYPSAREVFAWARTTRGGRQFGMDFDAGVSCTSQYGLCE